MTHHCDGCDQTCEVRLYMITMLEDGEEECEDVHYCLDCAIMAQDPDWSPEILACVEVAP